MFQKTRRYRNGLMFAALCCGLAVGSFSWYRSIYPYGRSHCCDTQLFFALINYADTHDGNFPTGEATPEASLGLIQSLEDTDYLDLLCGKSGSQEATQAAWDRDGSLGPKSCGWNYTPGLRKDDDPNLALFWDKEGLGHNGERLEDGGHQVMFLNGSCFQISAAAWDKFLAEQEVLLKQCRLKREENSPSD